MLSTLLSTIVPHYHTNIRDDGLTHAGNTKKKHKIIENWNWDEIIPTGVKTLMCLNNITLLYFMYLL